MNIKFFEKDGILDVRAVKAGVYQFKIGVVGEDESKYVSLYVGESYSMMIRCSNHVYEVIHNDPTYFGLKKTHIDNEKLSLIVEVYESVEIPPGTSNSERDRTLRNRELSAIEKLKPLAQLETSDNLKKNRVEVVSAVLDKMLNEI